MTQIQSLWRFILPCERNDGGGTYWGVFPKWERSCLDIAGGFTDCGTRHGAWHDPKTGRIYTENMRHYEVACDQATAQALLNEARKLFPDQLTFMVVHVGTAIIHEGKPSDVNYSSPNTANDPNWQ